MSNEVVNFTTPVGRLVQGSLYKGQTTDAENRPLTIKSGPNAGQPRVDYYFALAIPKGAETHWSATDWGRKIWEVGHKAFPQGQAGAPTFAWKVTDGDSAIPNRAGRKPCDREGFKGHWVLHFSSGFAPRIFNANGTAAITEPDAVKLGYYIQVNGSVAGNESLQQPGVYLNHSMVALSGYGEEIIIGPDPSQAGFGTAPLPAGAFAVPVGAFSPPALAAGVAPPAPAAPPVANAAPSATPAATAPVAPPPPVQQWGNSPAAPPPVAPNPAFVTGAAGVMPPPPPPPAAAAPVRRLTQLAGKATYEQLIAAGWTDQLLIQHGMMQP